MTTLADAPVGLAPASLSEAESRYAEGAAISLEALVSRLRGDAAFKDALAARPRETLASAGISLEKEAIETLMRVDPERFDRTTDALFDLLDPDFLNSLLMPCCDPPKG